MTTKVKHEKITDADSLKDGDIVVNSISRDRFRFERGRYGYTLYDLNYENNFFHLSGNQVCNYYMKEVKMEEESKEKEAEKIKTKVSPLYDGMPVSAFYSDENSLKRIFDICYHFAEAFPGVENLYILPFMMGKTPAGKSYVDIHFWVNTDTLLKEPNFATEAEWWINGYIAGVENR